MAFRLTPVIRCLGVGHSKRSSSRVLSQFSRVGSEQYSTAIKEEKVLTSQFSDVDIPDVSYSKYIFDSQEKFGGYTALVSTIIRIGYTQSRCTVSRHIVIPSEVREVLPSVIL